MAKCQDCESHREEITDEDAVSIKLLIPKYNQFSVHELHYFLSGHLLADIKWIAILFVLFIVGKLSLHP